MTDTVNSILSNPRPLNHFHTKEKYEVAIDALAVLEQIVSEHNPERISDIRKVPDIVSLYANLSIALGDNGGSAALAMNTLSAVGLGWTQDLIASTVVSGNDSVTPLMRLAASGIVGERDPQARATMLNAQALDRQTGALDRQTEATDRLVAEMVVARQEEQGTGRSRPGPRSGSFVDDLTEPSHPPRGRGGSSAGHVP